MLPKARLTSHSRMSVSRSVITPSWLFRSLRFLLYSFCIVLPPLPSIFFFKVHAFSVLYCAHLCMKCSLGIFNFLKEISSFSHSIVFFCLYCSIRKAVFSHLAILWNSAFKWVYFSSSPLPFTSLLSQLFLRLPQTTILPFFNFLFLWMVLTSASCSML